MKKTLLKIHFTEPTFVEQGGSVVKALFVITNDIKHLSEKIMYTCEEGFWQTISKNQIKSIEFKQPNEL